MVLPGPARLSVSALVWLLEVERIGEPHVVLAPAAVWCPPSELEGVNDKAREEIAELGWYDRRGRLEVEVGAALGMMCRGDVEFFGWISRGDTTIGVLAAGVGRHGLLAVRDGDSVWLSHTRGRSLAEAVVAQTPDVVAGKGEPVSVGRTELVSGQRITEPAARVGGVARRVRELVALPTVGAGVLYAAGRDGVGRYWVSAAVRYADTEDGRYVNLTAGGNHVVVAPASRAELVARLENRRRS